MPSDKKPIHTLVVNGCECEPYLTTDKLRGHSIFTMSREKINFF